ncbi:MAG: amidophosphoribosyltransferase, partial [Nitrosomonas sp. PRO5]|nr:amidophosphoribosyltransferase [Nitrosomonas sp. PRO5]
GIDMPTRQELIATDRTDEEICREIGADYLVYQNLDALRQAITQIDPQIRHFETSCFDGRYIAGNITQEYLCRIESQRNNPGLSQGERTTQLDLALLSTD